jgi:hypothetical protein
MPLRASTNQWLATNTQRPRVSSWFLGSGNSGRAGPGSRGSFRQASLDYTVQFTICRATPRPCRRALPGHTVASRGRGEIKLLYPMKDRRALILAEFREGRVSALVGLGTAALFMVPAGHDESLCRWSGCAPRAVANNSAAAGRGACGPAWTSAAFAAQPLNFICCAATICRCRCRDIRAGTACFAAWFPSVRSGGNTRARHVFRRRRRVFSRIRLSRKRCENPHEPRLLHRRHACRELKFAFRKGGLGMKRGVSF